MFAYPPPTAPPVVETIEMIATAVLSTTAKTLARTKRKEGDAMDTVNLYYYSEIYINQDDKKDEVVVEDKMVEDTPPVVTEAADKVAKPVKEESFELLNNFTRVTPQQLQYIQITANSRYLPVKKGHGIFSGIIVLDDTTPTVEEKVINFAPVVEPTVVTAAPAPGTDAMVEQVGLNADELVNKKEIVHERNLPVQQNSRMM